MFSFVLSTELGSSMWPFILVIIVLGSLAGITIYLAGNKEKTANPYPSDFEWDGDGQCHVAKSSSDFDNWEILHIEQWKSGVVRVYCRYVEPNGRGRFRTVYTPVEFAPEMKSGEA